MYQIKFDVKKTNKANIIITIAILLRGLVALSINISNNHSGSAWLLLTIGMFYIKKKALTENKKWAINTGICLFSYYTIIDAVNMYQLIMYFIDALFDFSVYDILVCLVSISYMFFCASAVFCFIEHKAKINSKIEKENNNIE